jgi:hypothetical protein
MDWPTIRAANWRMNFISLTLAKRIAFEKEKAPPLVQGRGASSET